jgi:hypothetical protein
VAYNLANFLRHLVLPKPIRGRTLTTLWEKLIKIGAKVVSHAKYVVFQLAEVAVPRPLCPALLDRIGRLRRAASSGGGSRRLTKQPEGGRSASAVRRAGGFRRRSEGVASCPLGAG